MFRSTILRIVYSLASRHKDWPYMYGDLLVWLERNPTVPRDPREGFVALAKFFPEFCSQLYFRFPRLRKFSWLIGKEMPLCIIGKCEIGPGLFMQHGFATTIGFDRAGRNLQINQCVTIGFGDDGIPTFGDNVQVRAGAKVFGLITVGDNVVIGANAVVSKDVPSNCVVAGVPARIIRRNGVRCNEPLGVLTEQDRKDLDRIRALIPPDSVSGMAAAAAAAAQRELEAAAGSTEARAA